MDNTEVFCSCGEKLKITTLDTTLEKDKPAHTVIIVQICRSCIEGALSNGYC